MTEEVGRSRLAWWIVGGAFVFAGVSMVGVAWLRVYRQRAAERREAEEQEQIEDLLAASQEGSPWVGWARGWEQFEVGTRLVYRRGDATQVYTLRGWSEGRPEVWVREGEEETLVAGWSGPPVGAGVEEEVVTPAGRFRAWVVREGELEVAYGEDWPLPFREGRGEGARALVAVEGP